MVAVAIVLLVAAAVAAACFLTCYLSSLFCHTFRYRGKAIYGSDSRTAVISSNMVTSGVGKGF